MDFIIRLAEEFFKKHKRLARYRRIFAFLAAVVVFATTYELILPAITMDRQRAFQSPGVEVGVAKDQRKGIEFAEDDSFAADSAGEDAFEAGFPEDGDFFEDDAGASGDGYAEDFSSDGTGSADDWIQSEDPGAGDTWENADEIVPGADSTGDDYSGSDADGSLTDADGTGVNASAGDDLAGVPSDSSDPENSGADISVPENAENDNTDDSTDLTDGNETDSEEAGLEGTGSASHEDGQDLETADGEDSEDAYDVSSENISGDNTQDASTGASTADSKETDDTADNNSNKGDTASGSTVAGSTNAGSTTAGSGEAVIEGGTAETAVEFAQDGAAAGATDLAALDTTGQAAVAITYPATIIYEGKDYTVTATFDEKAKLPAEVTLSAVEILPDKVYKDENGNPLYADYEEYYQKTLEALEKENRLDDDQTVKSARFFDITFLDKEGKAVEPAAPVSIAVKYKDALSAVDTADTMAVHFEDNKADNSTDANKTDSEDNIEITDDKDNRDNSENKVKTPAEITVPEILDTKTEVKKKAIQEISFEAESFSVYGVIGTEVIEKTVLASDGHNYKITVTYGPEADIPQGAELEVEEISGESEEFKKYVTGTEEVLAEDEKVSFARFFDISIVKDSHKIQPEEPVSVRIELADELTKDVKAVHFEHQKDAEEESKNDEKAVLLNSKLVAAEELRNAISFEADGFSVYGVVETITTSLLTADGKTLKVTVTYDENAQIPKGAALEVKEIQEGDEDWFERSVRLADVLNKNYGNVTLSDARFLNISILVEGKEYEPKAPVQVKIEYIEPLCTEDVVDYGYDEITGEKIVPKEKENRFVAIHYTDDGADLIDSENTSGEKGFTETIYDVDGFSEYDLVYMYDYDSYEAGDYYDLSAGTHTAAEIVNATKTVGTKAAGDALRNAGDIPAHSKSLKDNLDGTYTIGLNVTGDADTENNTASNANVIIIYDTSTSMEAPGLTYWNTWDDERNNYVPMQYGGRGIDSSGNNATSYSDGIYFQLYKQEGNRYVAIEDDTYTGTVYRRSGNNYQQYDGQRYSYSIDRADASEKVVYDFTNALFSYQNPDNPDTPGINESENIQAAFITFDTSANNGNNNPTLGVWTSNKNDILNRVDSSGTSHKLNYHNYTNWTSALNAAEQLVNSADNDPTYVVFITDGRPQTQDESAARPNYNTSKVIAKRIQDACHTKGGAFYGIFAFANNDDWLAALTYYAYNGEDPASPGTSFETEGYYKASDTNALTQAINDIFQKIVQTLGVGGVSIKDGTTSAVQTTTGDVANLLVVEESFQYWLTLPVEVGSGGTYSFTMPDKVTGNDVTYTATPNGDNITISWNGGSVVYPGKVEAGNRIILEWTTSNSFYNYDPPAAHHTTTTTGGVTSSAVDWNLNSLGTLLDGVTYTVTFDCYPSQDTLDIIADLKNAENPETAYNALDDNIKAYLKKSGNDYTLHTNTTASLTYTDSRNGLGPQTEPYTNPEPVSTSAVEEMAVSKKWENALDERTSQAIVLNVTRDEVERYHVTLSENNPTPWVGKAFVSIGIMTVKNGVVSIKTPGHDFSFEEPEDLSYHWELDVPVVHPMKINGVDTILEQVTGDEIPEDMLSLSSPAVFEKDGVKYYKMTYLEEDKYYKAEASTVKLSAVNKRRSSFNVTKKVTGSNAPADASFEFDIKVVNGNAANVPVAQQNDTGTDNWVWFSAQTVDDIENKREVYQKLEVSDNVEPEFRTVSDATYDEVSDTYTYTYGGKQYTLPAADGGAGGLMYTGSYYVKSGDSFKVKLKDDWNLRVMNLPTGSTYEVNETSNMPDECFEFVNVVGKLEYYEYVLDTEGNYIYENNEPVTIKHDDSTGTVTGSKIEGSITKTNSTYTATYTNKYDAADVTVTKNVVGHDDGSTFEIIATVTKNGAAVEKLPIQSDSKVSPVEGHANQLKLSLKNGESASVKLPTGATLSIAETANSDYSVSYSYKKANSSQQQSGSQITSVTNGDTMTVTNTRPTTTIHLKKVAKGETTPLPGSSFTLTHKNKEGIYTSDESIDAAKAGTTLSLTDGTFVIEGLPAGDYKLTEVKAPDGYIYMTKDIYFTVNTSGSGDIITTTQDQEAFYSESIGASTEGTNKDTLVIPNTPGEKLPLTGGTGKSIYTLGGIFIMMTTAMMYVFRMRRRERRLR